MQRYAGDCPQNALSFDLEHWYTATLLRDVVSDPEDRICESVEIVLDLLRKFDVRATFFVVGAVADEYPDLIRSVADQGHEIASHGHDHRPLFELSPSSFREELRQSATAIADATGERPQGFRAPNFSITRRTNWAFEQLREAGYRYDSSIFPMRTPMYGVRGAPLQPYSVVPNDPFADRGLRPDQFQEVPVAVLGRRVRFPIAGGFYGRLLPTRALVLGIKRLNYRGLPATLYFHPWEFNPEVVRHDVPLARRFVSFHGVDTLAAKLTSLLSVFEFGPIVDLLDRAISERIAVG